MLAFGNYAILANKKGGLKDEKEITWSSVVYRFAT